MNTKICNKCNKELILLNFEKRKDSKDGYRNYCNSCRKQQTDKAMKKWSEDFWNIKSKYVNHSGHRSSLSKETIKNSINISKYELKNLYLENSKCNYCYIELEKEQIIFDHKTPLSRNGLHNISNLCICCKDCNTLKGSKNEEEFKIFLKEYIKRFL